MGRPELSPHDETILFQLAEIERSLPREEQSRRFEVRIELLPAHRSQVLVEPSPTSKRSRLETDEYCFTKLASAGYISGGSRMTTQRLGNIAVLYLNIVELLGSAFSYYDEKHDFPTRLADERRGIVGSRINTVYPEGGGFLKKAYDAIWVDQPEDNWSSVAHDCRGALNSFADSVYKPDYASKLGDEVPSSSDFMRKLEQTIRANTDDEELRGLLVKLNRYANARRHDTGTTRGEAKRCVLLTYLLVAEICELLTLWSAT